MRTDSRMARKEPPREGREWVSGLVVVVAIIVSFVGFARVSVGWTLIISSVIFVGLVLFLWAAGGRKEP